MLAGSEDLEAVAQALSRCAAAVLVNLASQQPDPRFARWFARNEVPDTDAQQRSAEFRHSVRSSSERTRMSRRGDAALLRSRHRHRLAGVKPPERNATARREVPKTKRRRFKRTAYL